MPPVDPPVPVRTTAPVSSTGGRDRDHDRYEPCIDGWRGIAAALVLLAHFFPLHKFPNNILQIGQAGVTIFFIISGYLISLILFRSREQMAAGRTNLGGALRQFYLRRVLRITPVYYASIAGVCLLGAVAVREQVWWHLTYTTNFGSVFWGIDFKYASHFWTLAVEEQFYLIWPLIVLLVPQRRLKVTIRGLMIGSALLVVAAASLGGSSKLLMMLPIGGCSIALAYGAWLAYDRFHENRSSLRLARLSLLAGLPTFVVTQVWWWRYDGEPATDLLAYRLIYPWASVLFFGWLFRSSLCPASILNRVLSWPVLRYVGRVSYGLYVYHYLLDPFYYSFWARIGLHGPLNHWAEGLAKSATAFLIAVVSWHWFEKPILGLKDRWAPRAREVGGK